MNIPSAGRVPPPAPRPLPPEHGLQKVGHGIQKAALIVVHKIESVVTTILSAFPLVLLTPLNLTRYEPKKKTDCDPKETPILLIHGFLGSSSNLIYHWYRLRKAGHKNVFCINLGDPRKSIEEYAEKVAKKVERIQELTGRKDLVLVGHSMGGLVAEQYRSIAPKDTQVKKIITLGTPILGTVVAHLAAFWSKSAKEMLPNSPFLQRLKKFVEADQTTQYYHVGAKADLIVPPLASALGGETKYKSTHVIQARGHIGILYSRTTGDFVVNDVAEKGPA